jgi:hypothetical protein
MKKIKTVISMLLCCLVIASCASSQNQTFIGNEISTETPIYLPSSSSTYPTLNNFSELIQADDACKLPCWWGLVPEETEFSSATELLSSLKTEASLFNLGDGHVFVSFLTMRDEAAIYSNVSIHKSQENKVQLIYFNSVAADSDYDLLYDSDEYQVLMSRFLIANIFSVYGLPQDILVAANMYSAEGLQLQTSISLMFYEQGFFVRYENIDFEPPQSTDMISFCPNESFISLWLLPTEQGSKAFYQQALMEFDGGSWQGFFPPDSNVKTLEMAVNMDIQSFSEFYSDANAGCILSPQELWRLTE